MSTKPGTFQTGTLELHGQAGKRKRVTFYGSSQKEVRDKFAEAKTRLEAGAPVKDDKAPLAQVVDGWINTTLEASSRKPATKEIYALLLRNHILTDPLATVPIGRVRPSDIEAVIVRLRAKGLAPSTIRQIFTVLRQVLDTAVRDGLIRYNPSAPVKRPTVPAREARFLSPVEVAKLLDAASGSRFEPLLRLLVATGLRRGEALGLRWSDVDLTNGYLTVRGSLTRTRAGLQISTPKTDRSKRTVPLATPTVATLVAIRAAQKGEHKRAGSAWEEHGLIFSTEFGTPVDPHNALRAIKTAAKRADLRGIGLHTLRHTAASVMIEAGVPLKTVSEILGHASIQVTGDIYGHVSTDGARTAMDRLSKALGWEPT